MVRHCVNCHWEGGKKKNKEKKKKKPTLQPRQSLVSQTVLGQHAAHGPAQDLAAAPFLKHLVHGHAAQAAGPGGVGVVLLLEALLACGAQVMAAHGHDVVAAVGRGVVDGLVLAHEEEGDGGGEAAQRAAVGAYVDVMPCARVGKAGLLIPPPRGGESMLAGGNSFQLASCKGGLLGVYTFPMVCDMMVDRPELVAHRKIKSMRSARSNGKQAQGKARREQNGTQGRPKQSCQTQTISRWAAGRRRPRRHVTRRQTRQTQP